MELRHHGVPGQKWGVRRGPPYPIGESHSRATTASESSKNKKGLTDRQKDLIRKTIAVGSFAVAAYAGYQVHQAYDTEVYPHIGKMYCKKVLGKLGDTFFDDVYDAAKDAKYDEKTGFKLKDKPIEHTMDSIREDAAAVNPRYYRKLSGGYTTNCTFCAIAYDLRRRGFDVKAGFSKGNRTHVMPTLCYGVDAFLNSKRIYAGSSKEAYKKLTDEILSYGEGARGIIDGDYKHARYGHSLAFEVLNGKVCFVEPQVGSISKNPYGAMISQFKLDSIVCTRLDNLRIKPDKIKEFNVVAGWKDG